MSLSVLPCSCTASGCLLLLSCSMTWAAGQWIWFSFDLRFGTEKDASKDIVWIAESSMPHLENAAGRLPIHPSFDSTGCHPYGIKVFPISCHSFIPQNVSIVQWMGDWDCLYVYIYTHAPCTMHWEVQVPCSVGRQIPPFLCDLILWIILHCSCHWELGRC